MANRGQQVPNHPVQVQQHIMAWNWNADVPGRHRYHLHLHLLDAARALLLLGAVAAVSADGDDDAAQVLLGFATWLLGVGLLSLVPVAGRLFPQADALAGAAIANASAVLVCLFAPWNY